MDYTALLQTFDDLVAERIIHHTPALATRTIDAGYTFDITISPTLTPKAQIDNVLLPQRTTTTTTAAAAAASAPPTPRYGPGSDLLLPDERMTLGPLRDTHLLVYNMFSILRPQLLVITTDSYARQTQPLDSTDLAATYDALAGLAGAQREQGQGNGDGEGNGKSRGFFAFFNCGREAGGSRDHKHVQLAPRTRALFPDLKDATVPFRYFAHHHDRAAGVPSATALAAVYENLLARSKAALGMSEHAERCPHNAIMTLEWMVVIPRRAVPGLEVNVPNGPAMMGMVWLASEEVREAWVRLGPARLLTLGGLPAGEKEVNGDAPS